MAAVEAPAIMRADNRRLRGDLRKSRSMFQRTFRGIGMGIKRTLRGALSPIGIGAGAFGLAAVGREVLDFEETVTRLGIQAGKGNEFISAMRGEFAGLSKETGVSRNEIARGAQALVNYLGISDTTTERVRVLAEANVATGASMEDLASIAFKLDTAFGITSGEDLALALDALTDAGKRTSIPLSDMGRLMSKTAPLFKEFGSTGVDAAADLGALLQVVQKFGTAAGPEEVATQFAAFVRGVKKKSKELKKEGVNVFDIGPTGEKRLRSVRQILDDIGNSKLARDPALLIKTFGRGEAADFTKAVIDNRKEFEALAIASKKAGGTISRDAKQFLESPAGKVKLAFNNMKEAIVTAFTPERIETFAAVIEKLAKILEFVVDNAAVFVGLWAGSKLISGVLAVKGAMTALSIGQSGLVASAGLLLAKWTAIGAAVGFFAQQIAKSVDEQQERVLGAAEARGSLQFGISGAKGGVGRTAALATGAISPSAGEEREFGRILADARAKGLIDDQGNIVDPATFRKKAEKGGLLPEFTTGAVPKSAGPLGAIVGIGEKKLGGALADPAFETLRGDVQRAIAIREGQEIRVRVFVDERGNVNAEEVKDAESRRAPQ